MGLDPVSEAWVAYCFDEAAFMWGNHVESSIQQAVKKAKTDQQAQTRAAGVVRRLLTEPEDPDEKAAPAPGKFADPAKRFGK